MTALNRKGLLIRDARNRALRSFVQGLAIDLAVAVSLLVVLATQSESVDWRLLGASLVKTGMQTVASYVMRRFVDSSRIPTPLPPLIAGRPQSGV